LGQSPNKFGGETSEFNPELEQLKNTNKTFENELKVQKQKMSAMQMENQTLKDQDKRLTENMKSLKYKDLMESKLNVTTDNFNKEIKSLEKTLQRYMDDNKRLTMEVSRRHDMSRNFDNSMIQATVDNDKKLLRAQSKNT
jgi:FtsZ-binding cell division protein ZapB